jgi:hypothetical protein
MKKNILPEIVRAWEKEDWFAFEKFIQSPFCLTHQATQQYLRWLKEHLEEDSEQWRELAAADLNVAPARIYHLQHYAVEAVSRFLAWKTWESTAHQPALQTIRSLRNLKVSTAVESKLSTARRKLDADLKRGVHWWRMEYEWRKESFYASKQQGRANDFNLQGLSEALEIAFVAERLKLACTQLSHQAITQKSYSEGLFGALLAFIPTSTWLELPLIAGYFHGYWAMKGTQESEAHFDALKSILEKSSTELDPEEVQDLYLMAINYCIRRFNQNNLVYIQHAFDLYKSGLACGALLENGVLSRWTYNNIALTALHLREYEWGEVFLGQYRRFLSPLHQEGAYHLNMARFKYERKVYKEALQHLLKREHDDPLHNLGAKVLLAKIYWETEEVEALLYQLDSIDIYLRRQKIMGYHLNYYRAFVKTMKQLVRLKVNDGQQRQRFRTMVLSAAELAERSWFLAQVLE